MKNWFSSLWRSREKSHLAMQNLPWADSGSIYDHIARHIDPQTGKLSPAGWDLPDAGRRFSAGQLRWIPGAGEGVFSHEITPEESAKIGREVSQYVLEIATEDSAKAEAALYGILLKDEILSFVDNALKDMIASLRRPTPRLHSFAVFLAKTAPDRGPVKFAIALLGIIHDPEDVGLIRLLGLHEEFTLYAGVALSNLLANAESELWSLAKKVDGWGKIHLVERLASTNSAEIKDWLLRDGYRNCVMNEYLAYPCAVGGGLRDALYKREVDDELFRAAGEIIDALLVGGPAKDIHDYSDAADVVLRYLGLLKERASRIDEYLVANSILGYLTDEWDADARAANGWTPNKRYDAVLLANRILERSSWFDMVKSGLHSSNEQEFWTAARAAEFVGIDTWEFDWARVQDKPWDGGRWFAVMKKADNERIDQVLDLAIRVLPLEQVATGAAMELGLGPKYQIHHCLDFIVQDLKRFPGKGWPLIAASLRSPVVRNRNMALNAIEAWVKGSFPAEVRAALLEAAQVEPDQKARERLQKLLVT